MLRPTSPIRKSYIQRITLQYFYIQKKKSEDLSKHYRSFIKTSNFLRVIIYQLMNNKRTNSNLAANEEEVDIICQQITKNKEQIELFYAKNKMKFPPILQSRNIMIRQKLPFYVDEPPQKTEQKQTKKSQQTESSTQKIQRKQWMEKQPSILQIVFSKSKGRRSELSNARSIHNSDPKVTIINNTSRSPKKYYISVQKSKELKFLNEPCAKDPTIEHFIQQVMRTKSNSKKNTFILTKSFEVDKQVQKKRIEPLSINQLTTINPEAKLQNTFRFQAKRLTIERQVQAYRKVYNPKATINPSYNNEGNFFKKRQIPQRKQGYFQPWQQQSLLQDDYFPYPKR